MFKQLWKLITGKKYHVPGDIGPKEKAYLKSHPKISSWRNVRPKPTIIFKTIK